MRLLRSQSATSIHQKPYSFGHENDVILSKVQETPIKEETRENQFTWFGRVTAVHQLENILDRIQ